MMRRTLAQEIAYRPGGLLAAKVHLKHVSAATTEGYASRPGGAQARLLAEIGEFEAERNLDLVAGEYRNYQNGIMPAGPGGQELAAFFDGVEGQMAAAAPNVAGSDQHLLNLLSKRAKILHISAGNFCWFADPSRALCLILAGRTDADAPLIGMCDSARCPQATHHLRHRDVWAGTVAPAPCSSACSAGPARPSRPACRPKSTGPSASWTPSTPPRLTHPDPAGGE